MFGTRINLNVPVLGTRIDLYTATTVWLTVRFLIDDWNSGWLPEFYFLHTSVFVVERSLFHILWALPAAGLSAAIFLLYRFIFRQTCHSDAGGISSTISKSIKGFPLLSLTRASVSKNFTIHHPKFTIQKTIFAVNYTTHEIAFAIREH